MMRILAIKSLDVNVYRGVGCKRLEKLAHERAVETADLCLRKFCLEDKKRPPGNIDRHPRQGFVHGQVHIRKARNPRHVAQGLTQRLAESNAGIFDGVVLIDVKIALGTNFHVDERMASELLQHMVEETDAGRDIGKAG